MHGYIHSTETFGTVDGPGIRFVVFMQGCPLRCLYCHNPDTWQQGKGSVVTPEELIWQYHKNKAFYTRGGITVTGGEPLMQTPFVTELFRLAKGQGIHTCIDTSGVTYREGDRKIDELMRHTDLVMLDIKHIDREKHKALTGVYNDNILDFARYLSANRIPLWVRHVVIPGVTDTPCDLLRLGRFIGSLSNVKALDVLPYHTLGISKYEEMGMEYPLADIPPMTKEGAAKAKQIIIHGYKETKNKEI